MAKRKSAQPGDFVQIPLEDGTYAYGKVLGLEVAFLDLRTSTRDVAEDALTTAPTLFRVWVMRYAFSPKGSWNVIGHADLSTEEQREGHFFKKDLISGKLTIYQNSRHLPGGYLEYPATYDECVGLERAAVWDPEHVESRLLDHFHGRENKWVRSLMLQPE